MLVAWPVSTKVIRQSRMSGSTQPSSLAPPFSSTKSLLIAALYSRKKRLIASPL